MHLELVGTVENVAKAKAELIQALPPGGVAVVPEEPCSSPISAGPTSRCGDSAAVRDGAIIPFATSFAAPHQLQNTLAALTVCDVLGVPVPDDGALDVEFSPLREEVIEVGGGVTLINDCYNANPVAMSAALEHLTAIAGDRRKVAVLGEMAELGPEALTYHRVTGTEVARAGVEVLVAVGLLAVGYVETAEGVTSRHVDTAGEALEALQELLEPGDVVLVKGSRAVGLEAVAAKLLR